MPAEITEKKMRGLIDLEVDSRSLPEEAS